MGVPLNLNNIQSGFFSADAYNENNALIEEAVNKALDRTGGSDNAMEVDLDMGLYSIFNLKNAILSHQAVPLQQVRDLLSASSTEVTSLVDIEDRYTATGGEVEIVLENIVYTPATNSLMVFKNGEYQRAGIEYLETGTDRIEFAAALTTGDDVDIFGSRYDAQQYVDLAITAADNAEGFAGDAETSADAAAASAATAASAAGYKLDINDQTGTSYTLQLSDEGDFVRMDNADANTVTVPTNDTVAFEIGTIILVRQIGAGTTTINPAIGVTVNAPFGSYEISQEDFGVALVKVATDEWDLLKAFGGVDTSDLVAFSQEFDARLQDFYEEILSSDPTFVVNFDALQNNVNNAVSALQAEFDTLETNTNDAVTNLTASFNVIDADFTNIENQFSTIQTNFATIQSDFSTLESNFSTIQSDFTDIQTEFSGFQTLIEDTNSALDSLNLDGTFDNSLTTTGYQYLPGGLLMQWGSETISPLSSKVVTFPVEFPNDVLNITLGNLWDQQDSIQEQAVFVRTSSPTSVTLLSRWVGDSGGHSVTNRVNWFAIGY